MNFLCKFASCGFPTFIDESLFKGEELWKEVILEVHMKILSILAYFSGIKGKSDEDFEYFRYDFDY